MSYPIREWTEGFCCGLENAGPSGPGAARMTGWIIGRTMAQRRRRLLGWMYNEVLLPPFPVAGWDRETYPYLHLYVDVNSGLWTLYAQSKKFQYGEFTLNNGSYYYTAYAVYEPEEPCIYQRIRCVDGAWSVWEAVEKTHSISYKLYTYTDPIWSNYDLEYTADGTLFLEASKPVPVYQ